LTISTLLEDLTISFWGGAANARAAVDIFTAPEIDSSGAVGFPPHRGGPVVHRR